MMKFNSLIFSALFCLFFQISSLFSLPSITSVSPHFGPVAGGTLATIQGTGFKNVKEINFGKIPALSFQVINENTLVVLAPPQTFGAVPLQVVTPEGTSQPVHAAYYTYQGAWFAYVPNFHSNTVTSINLSTGMPETHIEVGDQPNAVVITPDGKTAYVTVSGSDHVVPIDLTTHQAGAPIPIRGSFPTLLSLTPDGKKLYVVSQNSHRLTEIDLATHQVQIYDDPEVYFPFSIATTPNGLTAYLTNSGSHAVTPFDLTTHTNQGNINKFNHPASIALTPDGKRAYVVNAGSNSVTPLDLETHYIGPEIAVGMTNQSGVFADIAICPNGKKACVTNPGSNSVTLINLKEGKAGAEIGVGFCPDGIAMTPDGKKAYVSNGGSNHVTPIDLEKETSQDPIPVGKFPSSLAITPDQAPVAYFLTSLASAGLESAFDASASVSPVGSIARYTWDFGDGRGVVDSQEPVVSHLYSFPGKYQVTLTVENSAGTSTTPVFTGRTMSRNGGGSAQLSQWVEIAPAAPPSGDLTPLVEESMGGESTPPIGKPSPSYSLPVPSQPALPASQPPIPPARPQSSPQALPSPSPSPQAAPPPFQSPTEMDQFLQPCAPSHVRGCHKKSFSRGKKQMLHVLTWKAPRHGSKPVCYRIYRDRSLTRLVGEVSARKHLRFQARQKKGAKQTYYIISIDKEGRKSPVTSLVVPGMGKNR